MANLNRSREVCVPGNCNFIPAYELLSRLNGCPLKSALMSARFLGIGIRIKTRVTNKAIFKSTLRFGPKNFKNKIYLNIAENI